MDDVVALGGRFLDAHEPYSVATCRDTLAQLALLHASTWGDAAVGRRVARPAHRPDGVVLPHRHASRVSSTTAGAPISRRTCATRRRLQAAMRRTAEVAADVRAPRRHPLRQRLPRRRRERACWLDWQITQRGHWSIDVAYHLGTVLDVETRRANEADLLRHYLGELELPRCRRPVVRRGVGPLHPRVHLGLLPLGHHPDQLPGRGAPPHPAAGRGPDRPRHVPPPRGRLTLTPHRHRSRSRPAVDRSPRP